MLKYKQISNKFYFLTTGYIHFESKFLKLYLTFSFSYANPVTVLEKDIQFLSTYEVVKS